MIIYLTLGYCMIGPTWKQEGRISINVFLKELLQMM